MGQQEIFSFLKKNRNKWFTTKQIVEKLKASFGSVTTSLKILRQSNQINHKKIRVNSHNIGRREVFVYKYRK